jgi:hypothetical protein
MTPTVARRAFEQAIWTMAFRGLQVQPNYWGIDIATPSSVCLCGALLAATGASLQRGDGLDIGTKILAAVAAHFGITLGQAAALNNGFEGLAFTARHTHGALGVVPAKARQWYDLGKAFRKRWQAAQRNGVPSDR